MLLELAAETKAWLAENTARVVQRGHQLHGGVSVVDEHELIQHFRRNLAESLVYGSPAELWPVTAALRDVSPGVQGLGVRERPGDGSAC